MFPNDLNEGETFGFESFGTHVKVCYALSSKVVSLTHSEGLHACGSTCFERYSLQLKRAFDPFDLFVSFEYFLSLALASLRLLRRSYWSFFLLFFFVLHSVWFRQGRKDIW